VSQLNTEIQEVLQTAHVENEQRVNTRHESGKVSVCNLVSIHAADMSQFNTKIQTPHVENEQRVDTRHESVCVQPGPT